MYYGVSVQETQPISFIMFYVCQILYFYLLEDNFASFENEKLECSQYWALI